LYVKDKKIGLGLAALGDLNISILGIQYYDKSQELLWRMLLVFLILPINMVFVILIQLPLMERARVLNRILNTNTGCVA
jgi:hypothetical protein